MQILGILSLLLCVIAMFFIYVSWQVFAAWIFGISLLLLAASLCVCIWEINISVKALEIHLEDISSKEKLKQWVVLNFPSKMFCQFGEIVYLCTRNREITFLERYKWELWHFGPFVYRLGRKIFILERGVRFPYGLPIKRREISLWLISLLFYYTRPFFAIFTSPTSLSR